MSFYKQVEDSGAQVASSGTHCQVLVEEKAHHLSPP